MLGYPVATAKRCFSRVRTTEKGYFREDEGKSCRSDNCRVIYGTVTVGQLVPGGQVTGITDGIRQSDWY